MNISVFGLGKLGLPLAVLLANSGNKVIGVDKSEKLIFQLNSDTYRSSEPELEKELKLAAPNISFTCDYSYAVDNSEIAFIIVPTPSNSNGSFSNYFVKDVIKEICTNLKDKDKKFIFNVVSTVMPGTCENELSALIEAETQRKISPELGITYNPEFIALGSVIENMKKPDMHLIGTKYYEHGETVNRILSAMSEIEVQEKILTLTEAEIVKISVNNFITMKIHFANSLSQISAKYQNTNIDHITESIGLDSRIGTKYLKAGTPFGGPCFPRDTRAMTFLAEQSNISNSLSKIVEAGNEEYLDYLVGKINLHFQSHQVIGILGISYKPNTNVLEESPGVSISEKLKERGRTVICWDDELVNQNFSKLEISRSLDEFITKADCIVITRPLPEYTNKELSKIKTKPILDLWRNVK